MQPNPPGDRSSEGIRYWKINLGVISVLLTIWAIVSCLCGIVFIEWLNEFTIGKLPLGFWIANQGSMLVFVLLILIYAVIMDGVDRRFRRARGHQPIRDGGAGN